MINKRRRFLLGLGCALLITGGCSSTEQTTQPPAAPATVVTVQSDGFVEGIIGPGSYYALYRPANWNGDLVVIAHGYYASIDTPVPPRADEPFFSSCRDSMLALGYGLAYTSYPELGWCVEEGLVALQQLHGQFTARFGSPKDTYIAGLSMGGLMVVAMAEQSARQYAGALVESGPLGGTYKVFQQVIGVRVLFDYFYPGIMPGTAVSIPQDADVWGAVSNAVGAMMNDPAPLMDLASVDQLDLRYEGPDELVTCVMWHLYYQLIATNELAARIGGSPLDNQDVYYTGTSNDADLNARVARFQMPPAAHNYLDRYYVPKGRPQFPVLTLHHTRDPLVPLGHEESYAEMVAAAGRSDLLRQRIVDFQDHSFTTEETMAAFHELVDWVHSLRNKH